MIGQDASWNERCRNAILLLLALLLALFLVGVAMEDDAGQDALASDQRALPQGAEAAHASGVDLVPDDADTLPFELFSLFSGYSAYECGVLPEGFAAEVLDPGDYGCLQPTWSSGVVGMVCPGNMQEVIGAMSEDLAGNGWVLASEGEQKGCLTFVKAAGVYRWLFISGSEVAGSSSIWMVFSREGG